MAKAMTLVGLDVHARQTHAAVLDPATGELGVSKLRMPPEEVVSFLQRLEPPVRAVYEAGPTGFGLARAARERGIDLHVAAPGSIPKGAGDRVKTDRRDAVRLARLLAAGELSFAFVPSVADECFRDLLRCIEDARGDLMRARHRLPAVYPFRFFTEVGGLLSYGNEMLDNYPRAASYVDRILKGAKPSDLPVQLPTKFWMVINLKSAKGLGLAVPDTLLARADNVIE